MTMVSGSKPTRGDLLIEDDQIAAEGTLDHVADAEVIDARDRIVLPTTTSSAPPYRRPGMVPADATRPTGPGSGAAPGLSVKDGPGEAHEAERDVRLETSGCAMGAPPGRWSSR